MDETPDNTPAPGEPGTSELQSTWTDDAVTEPPNSTVDDWMGQRVKRDEDRAEDALRDADGDEAEAERRFEQRTEREPDEPTADGD